MKIKSFEFQLSSVPLFSVPIVNIAWRAKKEHDYAYQAAKLVSENQSNTQVDLESLNQHRLIHVQRPYQVGTAIQLIAMIALAIFFPDPIVIYLGLTIAVSIGVHLTQKVMQVYQEKGIDRAVGKADWNGPVTAFTNPTTLINA